MYSLSQIEEACKVVGVTPYQFELLEKVLGKSCQSMFDSSMFDQRKYVVAPHPNHPLVHVDPLPDHIKPLDRNCPVCRDPLYAERMENGFYYIECSGELCDFKDGNMWEFASGNMVKYSGLGTRLQNNIPVTKPEMLATTSYSFTQVKMSTGRFVNYAPDTPTSATRADEHRG